LRIRREPENRRGGGRAWLLVGAVVVVLAGAAAYFFAGQSIRPKKVEMVTASVVTEGQATTVLTATGYIEAERKADLSPKITSRITELNVTEGSRVRKGDVIARLDHTDIDAQLADARASWVSARADLARQQSLQVQGLAPQSSLDSSVALEASTRAKVEYARALLDYTEIRAPFGGVITAKRAFVGEAVSPFGSSPSGGGSGGAIVTLVEFSSLYVGADVNEANLSRLHQSQPAEITLDAVLVPKSTVARVDGRTGVFKIADGRARFAAVQTGGEVQGQIEITSGLQGGEKLVAAPGSVELRDGDRVRIESEKAS
jgi:multidrug efflux pump subunit AcrA (membrane-fusion protein)